MVFAKNVEIVNIVYCEEGWFVLKYLMDFCFCVYLLEKSTK